MKKDYPTPPGVTLPPLPLAKRLRRRWRTLKWRMTTAPDLSGQLDAIERLDGIGPDEICVVTRQRNGIRYVRSFLAHYRALGADRIVFIDEKSDDGTPELLAGESDVITLTARTSFREANRGNNWFNAVLTRLPKGQRVVIVDNDEYLVFGDGTRTLADLFAAMKRCGLARLACLMVDLYPPAPIRDALFDGSTDQLPWQVARLFDATGYSIEPSWRGLRVKGGVRRRLFGEELVLTKHPAMFNDGKPIIDRTIHFPQPMSANRGPVGGALLHFKYFSDFVEEHERIVATGVHNKGAATYRTVLDTLEGVNVADEFDFAGEPTRAYQGPAQLAELGLIENILD